MKYNEGLLLGVDRFSMSIALSNHPVTGSYSHDYSSTSDPTMGRGRQNVTYPYAMFMIK